MAQALAEPQFRKADGHALAVWAKDEEGVRLCHHWLTATEQGLDQACCQRLGADAVVLCGRLRRPSALPDKLNGNWLDLFGDPGAVNPREYQHVIATGSNGADFIFFMREHYCFKNGSVGVGDGHNDILHPRIVANQYLALYSVGL